MLNNAETAAWHDQVETVRRAAVLTAPGQFVLTETVMPPPAADEVIVRLEGCGVCASNLAVWAGAPWFSYPLPPGAPGHEGWGVVIATGSKVIEVAPGDRVTLLSQGAYATHDRAPADQVVRLPRTLGDMPFPGEPLGCAVNIFRRSHIRSGMRVAIVGIGFLGALLAQLITHAGGRVIALARRPVALDAAEDAGAETCIRMDDHHRIIEQVQALTGGAGCDVVIEATGHPWPLDLAAELTAERGRLVIAGYHQDGPRQVNMQLWNWRGLDVVNAHERDPRIYIQGMREAINAVTVGALRPDRLYTHTFALDDIASAFQAAEHHPDTFMKALIIS